MCKQEVNKGHVSEKPAGNWLDWVPKVRRSLGAWELVSL